jgi:hypothetical protein
MRAPELSKVELGILDALLMERRVQPLGVNAGQVTSKRVTLKWIMVDADQNRTFH